MDSPSKWLREQGKAMEEALASLVSINSFTENRDGVDRLLDLSAVDHVTAREAS